MAGGGSDAAWGSATGTAGGGATAAAEAERERTGITAQTAAVNDSLAQLRTAIGESIARQRPVVIEQATAVLTKAVQCKNARDEIIESLQSIFPDLDTTPWLKLGDEEYFNIRSANFQTLLENTYPTDDPDSDRLWGDTASEAFRQRLSQETLKNPQVQMHLWGKENYSQVGDAGPWGTVQYKRTDQRWCWVSTLDTTFRAEVPDFGSYDNNVFEAALSSLSGTSTSSTDDFATSDSEEDTSVFDNYPHGWLTTLETAIAMLGYYVQSADQTQLISADLRNSSTNFKKSYSMFTQRDIDHLLRGDIDTGWNSIMDANHSNKDSWTKNLELPYDSSLPLEGENAPRNFLNHSFALGGCGTFNWRVDDGITSTAATRSDAHSNFRPYSILFTGGPLEQGLFNSWSTFSTTRALSGANYSETVGNTKTRWLTRIEKKLNDDASRFDSLSRAGSDDATAQLAAVIMNSGQASMDPEQAQEALDIVASNRDSNIYENLAGLLRSVASLTNSGILDQMHNSHGRIAQAHRQVIEDTCDAIDAAIDFESGDGWEVLGLGADDDWDDNLGVAVLANMGDPLEGLTATAIGEGTTSVMFKEQCFLLSFISDIANSKKLSHDQGTEDGTVTKRLAYHPHEANTTQIDSNASILVDGESYGFLNKLTQNPKLTRFYNALNHELSNLQPKIRLWKVIFDEQGNEQEIEIKFESHFSATDLEMFKTSAARGVGAGLKSFNFTYDGSNPFSVKKSIKANLKIFANTMSEILRDRPSHYVDAQGDLLATTYKYSDLAMKTWNTAEVNAESVPAACSPAFDLIEENTAKAELNFRLKAEVGFQMPMNKMNSMDEKLRESLQESFVTLNLTPTVHNFEIDDMGRVIFNLNFLAYIEQFFDQSMFNVFSSGPIMLKRMYRKEILKYYNSVGCDAEQLGQKKDDFNLEIKSEQEQAIASLMGDMMSADLIYYIALPYDKISTFLSYGPHASYDEFLGGGQLQVYNNNSHNAMLRGRISSALSTAFGDEEVGNRQTTQNQIQAALLGNDPREADLSFFYLSDLIDLVLAKIEKGLQEAVDDIQSISRLPDGELVSCEAIASNKKDILTAQKNLKKVRIMLGPVEFSHAKPKDSQKSIHANLGDVPISVKYFLEWLTNKMLQKDQTTYSLTKFVNDIINNLLSNFLNNDQCFGYSVKQKTRLNQTSISSYSPSDEHDVVTKQMIEALGTDSETKRFRTHLNAFEGQMPILNPSGPSNSARTSIPFANQYNFFVYFAGRVMPTELMKGNKHSDESNFGIFHYMLGRDRGLVKNIKLTKTQTKGLAEVRFETEGYSGLEQLRVTYDAQVDMFASVNTFPGTYIYIDPRGFAPEGSGTDEYRLTDLGIGGYYMIIRSEHEFAEGKANTTLHTKWVNQIDRDEDDVQAQTVVDTGGTGDAVSRRCSIQVRGTSTPDPSSGGAWWNPFD